MRNPLEEKEYIKRRFEKDYGIRGDYFRDQTAIINSMAFRRLKNKTQVFFAPKNDHVCTRIEHVMHVATIASTICKGLNEKNKDAWNLDRELAYAIGLGHDLGHAPFGHAGEEAINNVFDELKINQKFSHEINGYRVANYLSKEGKGLNLTFAVNDGITCHCGEKDDKELEPNSKKNNLDDIVLKEFFPNTYEGCIVRISDKIAYLGRDIEDALLANYISIGDIPCEIRKELGEKNGDIIDTFVNDLIENSANSNTIKLSEEKFELMKKLKDFNYDRLYKHKQIENYKKMGKNILENLFHHLYELINKEQYEFPRYKESKFKLDMEFGAYVNKMYKFYTETKAPNWQIVTDYLSGMTDIYALDSIKEITIPTPLQFGIESNEY